MSSNSLVATVLTTLLHCFAPPKTNDSPSDPSAPTQPTAEAVAPTTTNMADESDQPFSYADAVTGGGDDSVSPEPIVAPAEETAAGEDEVEANVGTDDDFAVEAALSEAGGSPFLAASQLWKLDGMNRLREGVDYEINTQLRAGSYSDDNADEPFIRFVSDDVWERPTYGAFKRLLDNYIAETGVPERVSAEETEEENAFLDAIISTPIGQFTRRWLHANCDGVDASDHESFRSALRDLWFNLYARDTGRDSSGFEHAFIGELDDGSVKGLHNFVQVFVEEQRGNFDYRGYLEYGRRRGDVDDDDRLITIRFEWLGSLKSASSMFVGVSPEFEICLYTLMWLTNTAGETVELGPYDVRVKVYDMHGCIGAAFPELVGVDYENPDANFE